MEIFDKIRKYENLHIIFWLIKDTCWMLELKLLGALMIFPTLGVAIYIIYKTRFLKEVYINFAVFFWILANSFWMICEFFINDLHRHYAIIPFIIGFIFVVIFYYKTLIKKT
jgi:hypothetical protein